jgi:hypothetical protein
MLLQLHAEDKLKIMMMILLQLHDVKDDVIDDEKNFR